MMRIYSVRTTNRRRDQQQRVAISTYSGALGKSARMIGSIDAFYQNCKRVKYGRTWIYQ